MKLNSTWSALEESYDIQGGYGYPAMDKAAEEMNLPPDFFTWIAAIWLFGIILLSPGLLSLPNGHFMVHVRPNLSLQARPRYSGLR